MLEVELFLRGFQRIDITKPVEIVECKEYKNYTSIVLSNALESYGSAKNPASTEYAIQKVFGKVNYRIEKITQSTNIEIQISKVKMPEKAYSPLDVLNSVEMSPEKLFVGIGKFGEEFIELNKIRHASIVGTSGFGKSSFLRYLLAINCAYNKNALNLVFAVKPQEFISLHNHPRVISVLTDNTEFENGFNFIAEELARREYYLARAFKIPPLDIDSYNEQVNQNKLDLPIFKHIFVWFDEARALFQGNGTGSWAVSDESMATIVFRARSAGIHLMFSTQRTSDLPSSFRHSISHMFTFYNPTITQDPMAHEFILKMKGTTEVINKEGASFDYNLDLVGGVDKAVKGRMSIFSVEGDFTTVQVPFVDQEMVQSIAFDLYQPDNIKFTPLKRPVQLVGDLYLPSYFFNENKTYMHFMNYEYLNKVSMSNNSHIASVNDDYIKYSRRGSTFDLVFKYDLYNNPILKKGYIEDVPFEVIDITENVKPVAVVKEPLGDDIFSEEEIREFKKKEALQEKKKQLELKKTIKTSKKSNELEGKLLNFKQALKKVEKEVIKKEKKKKGKVK